MMNHLRSLPFETMETIEANFKLGKWNVLYTSISMSSCIYAHTINLCGFGFVALAVYINIYEYISKVFLMNIKEIFA